MNISYELKTVWAQIKREFWEHSLSFKAPIYALLFSVICLVSFLIIAGQSWSNFEGVANGPAIVTESSKSVSSNSHLGELKAESSFFETIKVKKGVRKTIRQLEGLILLGFTIFYLVYVTQYLLTCLYVDRKDNSYLYWRSLPVNETKNVLIKFLVGSNLLPWLYFIGAILLMVFIEVVVIVLNDKPIDFSGDDHRIGFGQYKFLISQLPIVWFVGMLWFSPIIAWMLFSSAVAKKSPYLVFIMPFIIYTLIRIIIFGENPFSSFWMAYGEVFSSVLVTELDGNRLIVKDIVILNMFKNGYLIAVGITAALLAATIWLRNNSSEI
jgi:ABC-2 type transport system permease protein